MAHLQTLLDESGTWQLVPARSSVRFKNKTFWGLATVTGEFTDVRGTGEVSANRAVSGRLVIQASSLKTGIGKRDEHLRSADFFDVEQYPEIAVEVSAVEATSIDTVTLHATATILGNSHPLPLIATVEQGGDGTVRLTAQRAIDRTALGIDGNLIGMMPATTTLLADVVFAKA